MKKCCKLCSFYEHEIIDERYVCVNPESSYCTDWVEPEHCCEDFERKEDEI